MSEYFVSNVIILFQIVCFNDLFMNEAGPTNEIERGWSEVNHYYGDTWLNYCTDIIGKLLGQWHPHKIFGATNSLFWITSP